MHCDVKEVLLSEEDIAQLVSKIAQQVSEDYKDKRLLLDQYQQRMLQAMTIKIKGGHAELARFAASLDALSPLKVLGRGYAIARVQDQIISSVEQVETGDQLDLRLADGGLTCTVMKKERKSHGRKKVDL